MLEPNRDFEKEVTVADHIADWMQNGIHDEEELRRRLEALGNAHDDEARAIDAWDAEGGAPQAKRSSRYGRRIEQDGTWTIYEVLDGREARKRGLMPSGLTKEEALDRLVRFNGAGTEVCGDRIHADGRASYSFWRRDL